MWLKVRADSGGHWKRLSDSSGCNRACDPDTVSENTQRERESGSVLAGREEETHTERERERGAHRQRPHRHLSSFGDRFPTLLRERANGPMIHRRPYHHIVAAITEEQRVRGGGGTGGERERGGGGGGGGGDGVRDWGGERVVE